MKKSELETVVMENAIRIAFEVASHLSQQEFREAHEAAGACIAQLVSWEATKLGKDAIPVLESFKLLWQQSIREFSRRRVYQAALARSSN